MLIVPDYEDRHRKFQEFKEDIESRLEKWLQDRPEKTEPETKLLPEHVPNLVVRVLPSAYNEGGWVVYKNGAILELLRV